MSNEFKMVPLELLERVVNIGNSFGQHRQAQHDLVKFLAAAPRPAAPGGEPVVIALVHATCGPHDSESRVLIEQQAELPPVGTELIERAHLAPLQAENRRLRQFETALSEWADKTEWLRKSVEPKELGVHLADVMRNRIEQLSQQLGREQNEHHSTILARDNAETVADEMAVAIGERFRVAVGEHSNMNCPWGMALSILNGEYVTDSDADRERDRLKALLSRVIASSVLSFEQDGPEELQSLEADICAVLAKPAGIEQFANDIADFSPGNGNKARRRAEELRALAAQPANHQGEQMACMPVERCYDVRAKMIIAFNEAKNAGGDLDDQLDAAYKSALRFSPNPQ